MLFSSVPSRARLSVLLVAATVVFQLPTPNAIGYQTTAPAEPTCGSTSPLLLSLGDDYYNVSGSRKDNLRESTVPHDSEGLVLDTLRTQQYQTGHGQRTDCVGSGDALRPLSSSITLHDILISIETASHKDQHTLVASSVVIHAHEFDDQHKRYRSESMAVPLTSTAIETFSGILISSHQRHRQVTRQGAYLRETELTALRTSDQLILEQNVYVNGTLAQWSTWQLFH